MSQTATCPRCQSPLAADAPEGLCPACLMAGGLASAPSPVGSAMTTPWTDEKRAAAIADLAPHFPQLEIIELLGQGGMGAVYKARQKHLDRLIALKVIPPEAAKEPAFAERFAREARALARLNHPNIVTVYDFGQSDGVYFLLMEFVDGLNLRQTMQSGNLSPQEALVIVPHVCDALQYAHDQGIVHRDVKPENVLLDKSGRVKIADFGLAKLLTHSPQDFTLTHSMQVMGTPRYMAPEQIEHPTEVDHRADIYSLGVMFYEMLTGELPMGRFAPPSQKVQIDIRIDEIVLRSLEKEPARRFQKASDVKTELATVSSTQSANSRGSATSPGFSPATQPAASPPGINKFESSPRLSALSFEDESAVTVASKYVSAPGLGLMIAGYLGLVPAVLQVVGMFVLFLMKASLSMALGHPRDYAGLDIAPILAQEMAPQPTASLGVPVWFMFVLLLITAVQILSSLLMILGGRNMRQLDTYGLAVMAGICALLPTGPTWVISMPLGIWALFVLAGSNVRAGFRAKQGGNRPASGDSRPVVSGSPSIPAKPAPVDEWQLVNIQQQLFWPGLGLAGGAGLGLVAFMVSCLGAGMLGIVGLTSVGSGNAPTSWAILVLALVLLQIPWSLVVMLAGMKMMRMESYGLAFLGSCLALLPVSLAAIVTMPVGIWALVMLSSSEVREAFRQKTLGRN
jgi:serine/threonine protein kinase